MTRDLLNALFGLPLARLPSRGYLSSISKGTKKVATAQAAATENEVMNKYLDVY